jgi:hypothetical protein
MAVSTFPVALRAMRNGIKTDRDRFIFSYWLIWNIVLLQRIWIILLSAHKNFADYFDWLNSPVSGLITIGLAFTTTLDIPRKELLIFAMSIAMSALIAGIAIGVYLVSGWQI